MVAIPNVVLPAWPGAGRHDRPWTERSNGTIRYMNANGLRRKFDIQAYVERWLGGSLFSAAPPD